jgi:uncharacterized protein (DUF1697 family)
MAVLISMLRGVNLGSHNRIKMDALRALYESLKLEDPRTYVQSGNVIFRTNLFQTRLSRTKLSPANEAALAKKIQNAIEKSFGFSPAVILRTADEMRHTIASNPFSTRRDVESGKLLVTFLSAEPPDEALATLEGLKAHPEELHLKGRELYIYFPNGVGKTRLPWSSVEKLLKTTGTARNWNSVVKMLEIAEAMEAS